MGDPYQQHTHRLLHLKQNGFFSTHQFVSVFVIAAYFGHFCLAQSITLVNSCRPQTACFPVLPSLKLEKAFEQNKKTAQRRGRAASVEEGINVSCESKTACKKCSLAPG